MSDRTLRKTRNLCAMTAVFAALSVVPAAVAGVSEVVFWGLLSVAALSFFAFAYSSWVLEGRMAAARFRDPDPTLDRDGLH